MSRREARRARTVDEIVEVAVAIMTEAGAAGLSLGEIAKRMGLRTPSLYVYFPSKAALCDEIFARGWRDLRRVMASHLRNTPSEPVVEHIERSLRTLVGWALAHPGQAQLMFWRPIAGWEPAGPAFAPAAEFSSATVAALDSVRAAGLLRPDADPTEMSQVLSILAAGVISQQLSNEPGIPLEQGSFGAYIARLATMFAHAYGAGREEGPPPWLPSP